MIIFHIRHKIYDRKQRGQVFVQNLQETPNKIYKGILSMDEITSSGLYTTPTNSSISGRPNFREAIFRIETPRINKFKLEKEVNKSIYIYIYILYRDSRENYKSFRN